MELILFVVLLPGKSLAAFFVKDYKLRKLGFSIKCVVPGLVVSKPKVKYHFLVFVHLNEVCVFILVAGDYELADDLHE
jgi:hypothetical protein